MTTENGISASSAQNAPKSAKVTDDRQKQRLQKAVQDFEAMFVNYLLTTMRRTVKDEEQDDGGFGGDMMQEMFDFEMARQVSRTSDLGVGEMLYRKMTGESLPKQAVSEETLRAIGIAPHLPKAALRMQRPAGPPSRNVTEAVGKYERIIADAAERHGVDSSLIKAVIATESAGNPRAVSSSNAKGLMQLIDSTATMVGVRNSFDPAQNIDGGTRYLRQLLDRFDGDVKLALASYNAGPARVERHKGVPPIPETQQYVKKVMGYIDHFSGDK